MENPLLGFIQADQRVGKGDDPGDRSTKKFKGKGCGPTSYVQGKTSWFIIDGKTPQHP